MSPGKQTELFHVVFFDQRQHEPHEADTVQCERQEPMIGDEETQIFLCGKIQNMNEKQFNTKIKMYRYAYQAIDDDTKVIDQILTVEKVVGRQQKVPGQTAEPWQAMDAIHLIANGNDFFETFDLH